MSFEIFTDGAANIGNSLADRYDIRVIPFPYFLNGVEQPYVDSDEFDDAAYYEALKNGAEAHTSQINPSRYIEYFEPVLKAGKDLLFVGIAGGISGAFASAQLAREELLEQYPDRKICLVNSLGASLGEGMVALKASECRAQGMTVEQTQAAMDQYRMRIYQLFIVDDLMYLRRTGRISNFSAAIGSVLGIRPFLKGSAEGKIEAFGKARGKKAAIKAMAEKFAALHRPCDRIAISHCNAPEDARLLLELISPHITREEILLVKHEPATGSHLGPGALALYFEGDENIRFA